MCVSAEKREIEENLDRSELWRFYEKAVEGRNAHYSQYIQFTNLYAIFTGALLVAFYHLIGNASYQPYAIIVAILGLSTSILWFCSVRGYYAWLISWINVVRHYEECLNLGRVAENSRFVYGLFYEVPKKGRSPIAPSRFSTQKLTMLFVSLCIMGWLAVILIVSGMVIQEKKLVMSTDVNDICFMIALVIMALALFVILGLCFHKFMKDDVKSHYCLVKRKTSNDKVFNSFIIKSPSNEGEI